jgi:hypothetical protein
MYALYAYGVKVEDIAMTWKWLIIVLCWTYVCYYTGLKEITHEIDIRFYV